MKWIVVMDVPGLIEEHALMPVWARDFALHIAYIIRLGVNLWRAALRHNTYIVGEYTTLDEAKSVVENCKEVYS